MKTLNIPQGTPAWHAHRATHRNASESAIIMGLSPYKTRSEFMFEKFTGINPEISHYQQKIFDNGHRLESLARPLAEAIVGELLSPITGVDGAWSASFDGLTFLELLTWEHKTLNDDLRSVRNALDLPKHNRVQIEHGLMVSGAGRCLFTATEWDEDVRLIHSVEVYVPVDLTLRGEIVAAWDQFDKDYASYSPPAVVARPIADTIMQLPSVIINVRGELSLCNLSDVSPRFDLFLSSAKTLLTTDDDFANGEATAKFSRATAKTLKIKAREVVDQISSVSEAVRTLELYAAKFDKLGLTLEGAVKEQKDAIKVKILQLATAEFKLHVAELEAETYPIKLTVHQPNFADVMKNQRLLTALNSKVSDELARVKILADAVAKDVRKKLEVMRGASSYNFLFNDLQNIISKPIDDFLFLIAARIEAYKKAEEIKEAALKENLRKEALAEDARKIAAAEDAAVKQAADNARHKETAERRALAANTITVRPLEAAKENTLSVTRRIRVQNETPSYDEIINVLASHYGVAYEIADCWLEDFRGTAKNITG